jgi:carbamoyl-phosphate synthase small subunit
MVFLVNGPGDPEPLLGAIQVAKEITIIISHWNLFRSSSNWISNGISTYKMFNGHRGINHPVKNLISGKEIIRITVLQSIRTN